MNSQPSTLNSRPSVHLHIEELVLHGFAPGDRYRIGEAVKAELYRLLSDQGLPGWLPGERSVERLEGGPFTAARDSTPAAFGAGIAGAVYCATRWPDGGAALRR